MRAIPLPIRERIIHLYQQGKSTDDIAAYFGFCVAAVRRVRQQFKERGTLQPRTHQCGRKTLLTPRRKARLQQLVAAQPDATLAELGTRLDRSGLQRYLPAFSDPPPLRPSGSVRRLRAPLDQA